MNSKTVRLLCALSAPVVLGACQHPERVPAGTIPAPALRYASDVYAKFDARLRRGPADNDFVRFASDISHYRVVVRPEGDGYRFTFVMQRYHDRDTLDGRVTYRVEGDGRIELIGVL